MIYQYNSLYPSYFSYQDYKLEPMENPNPSTGDGSLDAICGEDATVTTKPMVLPMLLSTGCSQCGEWTTLTHTECCYQEHNVSNGNDGYCQLWGN